MRPVLCAILMVGAGLLGGCGNNPKYDVRVVLPATDGGVSIDQSLTNGTASLRYFSCSVSVRFGQCIRARPIQAVIVPSDVDESGSPTCPSGSAKKIITAHLGETLQLGKSHDGGVGQVWIQLFHGDDDDDSNVVNPYEMAAYAEITNGTLTIDRLDDHLSATVNGKDSTGLASISGTIGALDSENSAAVGVGPRCTWPIGAQPE